jgi:hypothetical protein
MSTENITQTLDELVTELENGRLQAAQSTIEDLEAALSNTTETQRKVMDRAHEYETTPDSSFDYIQRTTDVGAQFAATVGVRSNYLTQLKKVVRQPEGMNVSEIEESVQKVKSYENEFDQTLTNLEDTINSFSSTLPPILALQLSREIGGLYPVDTISEFRGNISNIGNTTAKDQEYTLEIMGENGMSEYGTINDINPGGSFRVHHDLQPFTPGTATVKLTVSGSNFEPQTTKIDFDVLAESEFIHPADLKVRQLINRIEGNEYIDDSVEAQILTYLRLARSQLASASVIILARVGTTEVPLRFEFEIQTVTNLLLLAAELNVNAAYNEYREYRGSNEIPNRMHIELDNRFMAVKKLLQKGRRAGVDENPDTAKVVERYSDEVERVDQAHEDADEITSDAALEREQEINQSMIEFSSSVSEAKDRKVTLADYRFDEDDWGIGYDIE